MEDGAGFIEKQYGINKIYRFGKRKKNEKLFISQKKEIVRIEKKEHATVVKMEFTNNNCFILLSDGRVFSRGQEDCLGRPSTSNDGHNKTFEEVLFFNQSSGEEAEAEKSAMIYNISAGDEHVLALDFHYNVWGWGSNEYLQIDPKKPQTNVKKPVRVILPYNSKVVNIYALQRSSMIISKNNQISMWGCISEGYLGDLLEKGENFVKEFVSMDKVTAFILNDVKKNDDNFTEVFINSRKLFNLKYNQLLDDNSNKLSRIEKLTTQITNLKADIQVRSKQNEQKMQSFTKSANEKNDKKIILLQELLKIYEKKLGNISIKKDNLRKELINIEEEINQKNIDLNGTTEQIDNTEDKMESYNNEITELKATLTENDEEKNSGILKKIGEKNKLLYNLKIYKESLMNNLQVIIIFLEEKEKERKRIADEISRQTDKENQYLKARYTVEDMIMIIFESLTTMQMRDQADNTNKAGSNTDKYKEKYLELFSYGDKLEKITFTELNKVYPYKIIEDILNYSNSELKNIAKNVELTKSTLSEMVREHLKIMFEMIETKIDLIREQNNMIRYLYNIFTNLESEIKAKFVEDNSSYKNSEDNRSMKSGKSSMGNHVEYIYKDLIIKFFEDAYRGGKGNVKNFSIEERERMQSEQNNYLKNKQSNIKKLEERSRMYEDVEANMNLSNVICFEYKKK
jgi:hypothetical protein